MIDTLLKPEVFGPVTAAIGGAVAWLVNSLMARRKYEESEQTKWQQETYERYQRLSVEWKATVEKSNRVEADLAAALVRVEFLQKERDQLATELATLKAVQ